MNGGRTGVLRQHHPLGASTGNGDPVHFGRPATVPANEPTLAPVVLPGCPRRHVCRGGRQITAYAPKWREWPDLVGIAAARRHHVPLADGPPRRQGWQPPHLPVDDPVIC